MRRKPGRKLMHSIKVVCIVGIYFLSLTPQSDIDGEKPKIRFFNQSVLGMDDYSMGYCHEKGP